ncbi:helix-turn-helix domain-containing protein [Actinomadura rugatobispora]|uniref:Helix-turn-helix domain-containing protein n=1 Tax=Actinomadura rugatobispora TaxID=1994 RepID=A0ABW1AF82_9ACTN|nr:helix-turn-helix transcriptional regulator [Actinomadura rugatobispora]
MTSTGPRGGLPAAPQFSPARGGPSIWRMLLGARLRRLREAAGVTREDAAYSIRASASKMSRLELGRVGFKDRDVADLLTLYGVHDERERMRLLAVVQRANAPQWWHRYGDIVPTWLETYIALEEAAHRVRVYATQLVPALLQTEDYARAAMDLCPPHRHPDDLDRRVELEMERQRILAQPDPPRLWALIDEGALRRPVGGRQVMRRQLRHLVEMTAVPNVTLQILPARLGLGLPGGPFTLLRFQEPDLPDVVYLEQLGGAQFLEKRQELDLYGSTLDALCARAAQPDQTAELVKAVIGDLG